MISQPNHPRESGDPSLAERIGAWPEMGSLYSKYYYTNGLHIGDGFLLSQK